MIDVVMPQMGESIVEGTLTKWLKKAGDHVERDAVTPSCASDVTGFVNPHGTMY